MPKSILLIAIAILCAWSAKAGNDPSDSLPHNKYSEVQIHNGYEYRRPKPFRFLTHIPGDYADFGKDAVKKDMLPEWGFVAASTLILLPFDQKIVDGSYKLGDNLHLSHENRAKPLFNKSINVGGVNVLLQFNVPFDATTAMYFLGDGFTHLSIAGAFWVTGLCTKDNRALQTSSELLEVIGCTAIATQFLKHVTGRESPFVATAPGGKWRVFPNQLDYANNVPHYDAYPTGHLATAMATLTVIASNYEEYRFIRPVGYTLMGMLGYTMLNNGVHWASDYPLGIAIGYGFAKIVVRKGRTLAAGHTFRNPKSLWSKMAAGASFSPSMLYTGDIGMSLSTRF